MNDLKHLGWDGRSQPILEQQADCGCRWFFDGSFRTRSCDEALKGQCAHRPDVLAPNDEAAQ